MRALRSFTRRTKSVGHYLKQHGEDTDVVTLCRPHCYSAYSGCSGREPGRTDLVRHDRFALSASRRQFELDGKKSTSERAELAYRERRGDLAIDLTIVVVRWRQKAPQRMPAAQVAIVSNIHEVMDWGAAQGREGVVFVGGFQHHNIDAVEFYAEKSGLFFANNVQRCRLILLEAVCPNVCVNWESLMGSRCWVLLKTLCPISRLCAIHCAAAVWAGVRQGKSSAGWLPVVGTSAALEGMGLCHRQHVLSADTARPSRLQWSGLYDEPLWRTLSETGNSHCESIYPRRGKRSVVRRARAGRIGFH